MRVALLTHVSEEYAEIADLTEPDKREYCRRWDMEYVRVLTPEIWRMNWRHRPMMWLQQLQSCDAILFMGADTMITNLLLNPWLPLLKTSGSNNSKADLVIASDCAGINSDVVAMNNTQTILAFLHQLILMGINSADNERQAMTILLSGAKTRKEFEKRFGITLKSGGNTPSVDLRHRMQGLFDAGPTGVKTAIVEQRVMNAYPQNLYGRSASEPYGWHPGDFVAHFPGLPLAERIHGVKALLPQVRRRIKTRGWYKPRRATRIL